MEFFRCENVIRIFKPHDRKGTHVTALGGISFRLERKELFGIMGPSGSGKTTLLRLIAGFDRVSSGHIVINGLDIAWASPPDVIAWRAKHLGYIHQNPAQNVIPEFTVIQNLRIAITLRRIQFTSRNAQREHIQSLLRIGNLTNLIQRRVGTLSGGETQRLSVALACLGKPELILADEPTGELDGDSAEHVMKLLRQTRKEFGTTILVATHDPRLIEYFDRNLEIRGGKPVRLLRTSNELLNYEEATSVLVPVTESGELRLPPKMIKKLGKPPQVFVEIQDDHVEIRKSQKYVTQEED